MKQVRVGSGLKFGFAAEVLLRVTVGFVITRQKHFLLDEKRRDSGVTAAAAI